MQKVIGLGNVLVDILVKIETEDTLKGLNLPKGSMQLIDGARYGEINRWMQGKDLRRTTGGSAANTILALANLGAAPGFIGKKGKDENGRFFTENCVAHHISFDYIEDESLATGVASTFITPDGQRTFATYLGAAAALRPVDIKMSHFEGYDLFYIEGYMVQNHDVINRAVYLAHAAGLKVGLDLASYNIVEQEREFFAELLKNVDIVFANEEESYAYTHKSPEESVHELAKLCETAVVKIGKRGSLVCRGAEEVQVPSLPNVKVTDTTAAGDYFAAGFLYGMCNGRSLEDCARYGTLLAGNIVQVVGTQLPESTWQEIRAIVS